MTGLILGICDIHNGVHSEGEFLGKPCVGWMVYEPIGSRSTSDCPEHASCDDCGREDRPLTKVNDVYLCDRHVPDDRPEPDHEPMLPASGIGNVPADQCGECGEVHTSEFRMFPGDRPKAISELDDEPSQMEILVTPDMLREIAEDLEREGDNFCRTLQTTTGEFIDLRNMSVECSACGDSLDVRDADDKMRCEPCHDADVTHDEQGNQITPV